MFTLAHLSDIHLGPLPRPRYFELMGKRALGYLNWQKRRKQYSRIFLDRLVSDLVEQKPDHIAITGDLVNIGLPSEFHLARLWLETLGTPDKVTVVPGNHDAYVHMRRDPGFRHWQDYMLPNAAAAALFGESDGPFPFVRRFGDVALVGLSSARATLPLMASGRLGAKQLSRFGALLEALNASRACRICLIHHPPLPGMSPWRHALHDARAAHASLMRHGAELILHGHSHIDSVATLHTPRGAVFVVGVAAASSTFAQTGLRARYNLFSFEQGKDGWRIHMRSRTLAESGPPVETDRGVLTP